ncbi:hypothetical protein ABFS82_04G140300 [Erythranthe guttata]|uniref:cysteine dioxygenase n=1 Tax=Erythranthe guttata TaxID=4155 RepID=A0A022RGZ6_ERYGU|nr:PREDICTED: plant cysteine oxidase 3 [Erythranthe guttata]EYU38160.1 hypothetical protein MIMGU_mgv1a012058mg [Erythranthe guttata]|eukprot:XP_012836580.1 PREDICTED: plant cysteine oxidase 3 [Erythranthe guttata]
MCVHRRLFTMTKKKSSSTIQALFDLCADTFTQSSASPPSPNAIHKLSSLLDSIGPADVGLSDPSKEDDRGHGPFGFSSFNRVDRWAQPITYVDVHEGENFTMCIFCFPTSSVIPLHDHPGMTVLSKVLYGSLHVKGYDWVDPPRIRKPVGNDNSSVRLAKLAVDKVLTAPCSTSVLYPSSGGNLHSFTAITPCAVLDILAPPYDEFAGRRCSYYRDYPCSTLSKEDEKSDVEKEEEYAWLSEIDTPDDLYMRSGTYTGPPIHK